MPGPMPGNSPRRENYSAEPAAEETSGGPLWNLRWIGPVWMLNRRREHNDRSRLFSLTQELLSHLKCHQASETVAAQVVRARWLNFPNLGQVMGGELLNGLVPHAHSIKTVR